MEVYRVPSEWRTYSKRKISSSAAFRKNHEDSGVRLCISKIICNENLYNNQHIYLPGNVDMLIKACRKPFSTFPYSRTNIPFCWLRLAAQQYYKHTLCNLAGHRSFPKGKIFPYKTYEHIEKPKNRIQFLTRFENFQLAKPLSIYRTWCANEQNLLVSQKLSEDGTTSAFSSKLTGRIQRHPRRHYSNELRLTLICGFANIVGSYF